MKAEIARDEWYPVYTIEFNLSKFGKPINLDEDFVEEYERVMDDFNDMQSKLEKIYQDRG
jgi:hypothetical protein